MPAGDAFGRAQLSRQLGSLGSRVLALALLLGCLLMGAQVDSFRYPICLLLARRRRVAYNARSGSEGSQGAPPRPYALTSAGWSAQDRAGV